MTEDIIEIKNLNYKNILNNFNIKIKDNQFITISGASNCGKTTLIRTLKRQINIPNTVKILTKNIEEYKLSELSNIIQCVIPKEISFVFKTVIDELHFYLENNNLAKDEKKKLYYKIIKDFKLSEYQKTNIEDLPLSILIKLQMALSLIRTPKILLIDNISPYLSKKEKLEMINILKKYQKSFSITIIMTTSDLNDTINTDYIYIISNGQITLEGKPIEVLKKDNILNKLGLNIPFIIDLSVKLQDYDLIDKIELNMDRMVDTLWK